jgi:23S rRNA pseudouridine2605 synthase
MKIRLQKILAQAGVCSRRKAGDLIAEGRVIVDGKIVTEKGLKFDPAHNRILFNAKPLPPPEKKIYLLLNKPKGYVTTLNDPQGRPIVTSLLTDISHRVFPVGRLDYDTEGALLLTNDGALTQRILHPSYEVNKTYRAVVAGNPGKPRLKILRTGIELEGKKTAPAKLKIISAADQTTTVEITIHEGRKRQVRKMFAAIGHRVISLQRIAYGKLKLGSLPIGKYRFLSEKDIKLIF